jgi:hypothetical protein
MAEYIDRDIVIAKMTDLFAEFPDEIGHYLKGRCIGVLLFEQAADVVEVVRCKDCKHWWAENELCGNPKCCHEYCAVVDALATHFCGYGERKTDNG